MNKSISGITLAAFVAVSGSSAAQDNSNTPIQLRCSDAEHGGATGYFTHQQIFSQEFHLAGGTWTISSHPPFHHRLIVASREHSGQPWAVITDGSPPPSGGTMPFTTKTLHTGPSGYLQVLIQLRPLGPTLPHPLEWTANSAFCG